MHIEIVNPAFAHHFLLQAPKVKRQEEGEEWKRQEEGESERLKTICRFQYNPVELPSPLSYAGLVLFRSDNSYSALAPVVAREPRVFNGISKTLEDVFKKKNEKFYSTSPNGTGYILTEDETRASICLTDSGNKTIGICIGRGGAYERKLGNNPDFLISIKELESALNLFIDCCLSPLAADGKIPPLPKTTLYMIH